MSVKRKKFIEDDTRPTPKSLTVEILTSTVDNKSRDISIKLRVFATTIIEDVLRSIPACCDFDYSIEGALLLKRNKSFQQIDRTKSLLDNCVDDGAVLYWISSDDVISLEGNEDYFLSLPIVQQPYVSPQHTTVYEVTCTTRICDADGKAHPTIRALIHPGDICEKFMNDVATLWNRKNGLKFKCGRNVLSSDKTFFDCGVDDGSEIVVTGGRA